MLEARAAVGGTAATDSFGGARVNVCNCDHTTIRTTTVGADLDLAAHGLRYIDLDPCGSFDAWSGGPSWEHHHEVDRTLEELATTHPAEIDGYRRYARAATPWSS